MDGARLLTLIALVPVLARVAVVDARTHRISNRLVLLAAVVAVAGLVADAVLISSVDDIVRAIAAAIAAGALYLALWWFADLGLGDVKLAAVLAFVAGWSGWSTVVAFVVVPHLLLLPTAVWRAARRRRDHLAFAPALVAGFYLAVVAAELIG